MRHSQTLPIARAALSGLAACVAVSVLPAAAQTSSPVVVNQQNAYIDSAERDAAQRYGEGTPEYWAALSRSYSSLEATPGSTNKSAKPGSSSEPTDNAQPEVAPLDRDPRGQAALAEDLKRMKTKMVGARPAGDTFRHAAAITTSKGICSGVRVGRNVLLTAAHCVCQLELADSNGKVHFGSDVTTGLTFPVSRVVPYTSETCRPAPGNDMALVFFRGDASLNTPTAAPAPMGQLRPTDPVYVVGFGRTEAGTSGRKLWAPIAIVSPYCGGRGDRDVYGCAPGHELIARDHRFQSDSCYGDSGGPAYHFDQRSQRYMVAGVVARSLRPRDCGGGGIYTLLNPRKVQWMVNVIMAQGD